MKLNKKAEAELKPIAIKRVKTMLSDPSDDEEKYQQEQARLKKEAEEALEAAQGPNLKELAI